MKKLWIFIIPLFLCSCSYKYTIDGQLPNYRFRGEYVYLLDFYDNVVIDSARVEDNRFLFTGQADDKSLALLRVGDYRSIVVRERGNIKVDMSAMGLVGGTPLNDSFNKFYTEFTSLQNDYGDKAGELFPSDTDPQGEKDMPDDALEYNKTKLSSLCFSTLDENNNNVVGILAMLFGRNVLTPSEYVAAYESAGNFIQDNKLVKAAYDMNVVKTFKDAGTLFKDFTVPDGRTDSASVSLSDYVGRGKYILVDFWASWCEPCRQSIPQLKEIYQNFRGEKFEILGVAVNDERENTMDAVVKEAVPWPNIYNAGTIPTELYEISGIPLYILFDPDGKIILRMNELNKRAIEKELQKHI
ncbi:MAG: AhpC/TSA family protein [Rikenellaceae bacterium]|nr:AhpC/TSA family protein [Rikenellaceae bacterium]